MASPDLVPWLGVMIGDAMAKDMWPIVISFADLQIGTVVDGQLLSLITLKQKVLLLASRVSSRRASFSSTLSDGDHPYRPGALEHAYSFVGMHCIFDHCKSSVTVLKFGHMSSDLLAYGASDETLTVCSLS